MATRYLQLDWKSSNLYEYSKNEQEGFEKHTSDSGKVTFRKYEKKGITGELLNVGVRDSKIGQLLTLAFKVDGNITVVQFNLYDQRNQVDNTYPEAIIAHLGNLKKGETYTVVPYNLTKEAQKTYDEKTDGREVRDKYYDKRAVSFKQDGVRVDMYLSYAEGEELSIPRLDWKEDRFNEGKKKPTAVSLEARNEFLLDQLEKAVQGHLAYESTETKPAEKQEKVAEKVEKKEAAPAKKAVESNNDLPF